MRIEKLSPTPDRAGRYWVRFQDGESLALYRQTVEDFGLYTGMELEEPRLQELKAAAGKMSAKMRAVRIVSASSVSKKDLQSRLVRKGETEEDAHNAVAWMEELRLVDDRNTAEQVVRSCIAKGYGLSRAKQALYEKRIPREYWEDALEDYPNQLERIEQFLRSRLDSDSDEKQIKRAIDALIRRGHGYGQIRRVLSSLSFAAEDYIEEY